MKIDKVVIADDSKLARTFLRKCLEIAGLDEATFYEAENGEQALQRMKEVDADLLVTDLVMPEMTGLDLMRRVSASPRLNGVPVLVVTSAGNEEQRAELLDLGVIAVLSKPVNPALMTEALEKIFAKEI